MSPSRSATTRANSVSDRVDHFLSCSMRMCTRLMQKILVVVVSKRADDTYPIANVFDMQGAYGEINSVAVAIID